MGCGVSASKRGASFEVEATDTSDAASGCPAKVASEASVKSGAAASSSSACAPGLPSLPAEPGSAPALPSLRQLEDNPDEEHYDNCVAGDGDDEEDAPGDEDFFTPEGEEDGISALKNEFGYADAGRRVPMPLPSPSTASSPMGKALREMQAQYPYLTVPEHPLNYWVKLCNQEIDAGDESSAAEHIGRIEQEVFAEERSLVAAFNRFNPSRSGNLSHREVKFMFEYLGFPSSDSDVHAVIKAVDVERDGKMSLAAFQLYVGRMGGSDKLFEVRRRQMMAKAGAEGDQSEGVEGSKESVRMSLLEAGIADDAQACWSLVVPQSELIAASQMEDCQKRAIKHIRTLAKSNHEAALPRVQSRVKKLGYTDNDLWMTLAWIRELAPIIVHTNLDKMMKWMEEDTHYRNQFETATSGGLLKPAVREKWERDLFGGCYEKAQHCDRCKYGVQNVMNDYRGVTKCKQYGDSYFVLKDARLRCTFSPEDSANLKANRLAVLDFYAHVLSEYNDVELKETLKIANSGDAALLGDSDKVGNMKYKEAQIHGEIKFDEHIERLVANPRHRKVPGDVERLESICKQHGWNFSWMDEERQRMASEEKERMGAGAWKERLKTLLEGKGVPDAPDVPEGYCRTGCGRQVAPGLTGKGKPYKTCCRGCVLGFGHDTTCGNIDPSLLGEGMCRSGCGRKVCPGVHPSGRPFTTCCRGCAMGRDHEPSCNCEDLPVQAGFCGKGCGRRKAKGKDGRLFATCCRGCACGYGHSRNCRAEH